MRTFLRLRGDQFEEVKREVVREQPLTVYVNGERFLTLLCSPTQLEALVVGYLWMEQVITAVGEIVGLEISEVDGRAAVTLTRPVALPTERVLTSGCGGGITFRIDHRLFPKRRSSLRVPAGALAERMKDLFAAAVHYQRSRGIHGAALSDGERLLLVAEDVGRHNAVDKVKGEALLQGIPTEDLILLSTGRISSEMLLKAARMGVPLVASRTSPTEMAVGLAEQLDITVCGGLAGLGVDLSPAVARAQALRIKDAKAVPSVCPYCAVGCGTLVHTVEGTIVNIEGDPASPVNEGTLCPKGAATYQLHVNPNRATRVLHRAPGATEWEVWDLERALDRAAELVKKTRDETFVERTADGRPLNHTLAIFSLGGATMDNEWNHVQQKLLRGLGVVAIENQARI